LHESTAVFKVNGSAREIPSELSASGDLSHGRIEPCPGCGALIEDGRAGCQAAYEGLALRALNEPVFARVQPLAFDTYCMQHLETYCRSAKSYAAHLTRLCCGVEHAGDPAVYAAIQRWLNGKVQLDKPAVLPNRGNLTVKDADEALAAGRFELTVRAWAENVWQAYAPQHALAHAWIQSAIQNAPHRPTTGNR
jgi:hypothetical protein